DFVDLLRRREAAPAQGWISLTLGTRQRSCGEVPLKLLDTLYGLLAFIARAIGEPGDGSSREAIAVLPKRSNGATIPFSWRDRGFESFSLQRRVRLSRGRGLCRSRTPGFARVCAAAVAARSAETRKVFRYRTSD